MLKTFYIRWILPVIFHVGRGGEYVLAVLALSWGIGLLNPDWVSGIWKEIWFIADPSYRIPVALGGLGYGTLQVVARKRQWDHIRRVLLFCTFAFWLQIAWSLNSHGILAGKHTYGVFAFIAAASFLQVGREQRWSSQQTHS